MSKCPECGRKASMITLTCKVPGCLEARFYCPACTCAHLGHHVKERDDEIERLRDKVKHVERERDEQRSRANNRSADLDKRNRELKELDALLKWRGEKGQPGSCLFCGSHRSLHREGGISQLDCAAALLYAKDK